MHATDLFHLFVAVLFGTQALILAVALWQVPLYLWHCWRERKNQRQTDETIHTLETALRTRPRVLADSRLPNRRARVRAYQHPQI